MDHIKARIVADAIQSGNYERTTDELIVPTKHGIITVAGTYWHSVNNKDWRFTPNLLPTEGINHILNSALSNQVSQITAWYLALHVNTTAPSGTNTASNYDTMFNEIKSLTEGYAEANRQVWTGATASAGSVDNYASRATFTIATATSVTVGGCALLSSQTRGSTSGVLASVTSFDPNPRTMFDGDEFNLGYRITLTSS